MDLNSALSQIADIRLQIIRTRFFRGYRATTTLATGIAAAAAAFWQAWQIPNPSADPNRYLLLWVSVAAACIALVGLEVILRYKNSPSPLQRDLTILAVEQLVPFIVAGGLLTFVLWEYSKPTAWILPGLWQILYALAIIGSRRLLPGWGVVVGAFYLLCGLVYLALAPGGFAYSPLAMGIPFFIGQTAAAHILYHALERNRELA